MANIRREFHDTARLVLATSGFLLVSVPATHAQTTPPIKKTVASPARENERNTIALADRQIEAQNNCTAQLNALRVTFTPATPPLAQGQKCAVDYAVRMKSITHDDGAVTQLRDEPLLSCRAAVAIAQFTRDVIAPLAYRQFAYMPTAISTGPGFECRSRNRVAGAKISAHGAGLAIDVMTMSIGKRNVSIETPNGDAEKQFLSAVRKAACGWFTTVLGPGSDPAHANHFHFDIEKRGRFGDSRLCQ